MFLLSSQNATEYLVKQHLFKLQEIEQSQVEPKVAKNFNLLLSLPDGRRLLVKQERYNSQGKTAGEFIHEWRIQELINRFPELSSLRAHLPEILHFNPEDAILVFNYLNDYRDLADFYAKETVFAPEIAATIGRVLATLHGKTFERQDYQDYFNQNLASTYAAHSFVHGLERISPEIFASVPADGLKFYTLYQRYDSLGKTIANLISTLNPCCLIHNDLKLNNILLQLEWEQTLAKPEHSDPGIVRFIDWERCCWGDPALDLGTVIASYLQLWLSSLIVSKTIQIEESLRLAMIPLEQLQPSIAALVQAYLQSFPTILQYDPNFLHRIVQFAGLALIQQIQAMIQHQKTFGNTGICMLQVAKSLLCRPAASISTVFGLSESDLIDRVAQFNLAY
ncbi:MAG TPA: phosphotransferase [Allocoleopsis sp.]